MTFTDYLINALFVLVVLRQARERKLDARSLVVPMVLVFFVARVYVHSIPTAGDDLALVAALACFGLALGGAGRTCHACARRVGRGPAGAGGMERRWPVD